MCLSMRRPKRRYVIPKPGGYFHETQLTVLVFGRAANTWSPSVNGSASYFDPLTKDCLATLIELSPHNTECHNLPRHHFRLSGTML